MGEYRKSNEWLFKKYGHVKKGIFIMNKETIIGLIPARSGSKRCPGKNTRLLGGIPLIAWTIKKAKESGIFTDIVVSTDSQETMEIATSYGVMAIIRPDEISQDLSNDYEWVKHALERVNCQDDAFGILRPTSPFRTAETIRECWRIFQADKEARSLRTIRESREHPNKSWFYSTSIYADEVKHYIMPWDTLYLADQPTQFLTKTYYQDGLFYINMVSNLDIKKGVVTAFPVLPYLTTYPENLDINIEIDFNLAEIYIDGRAKPLLEIINVNSST
jgi:CMP-N-acetylneuraminic acid synthetase